MPDPMTPPRACVEALTSAAANGDLWVHAGNRDDILHAVLAAFVAGEPSGPWKVQGCNTTPYAAGVIGPPLTPYWLVYDSRQPAEACAPMLKLATREQADAVANVLNYLEAQRG